MIIYSTKFKDLKIIKLKKFSDLRGDNIKIFNKKYKNLNFQCFETYVSISKKGTVRGLHGQFGKFSQSKLIFCVKGKVLDIAIDLRKNSRTYGKVFKKTINHKNLKAILIPKGFGHAFLTLSPSAIVSYQVDTFYNKKYDNGIKFDDPNIKIKWKLNKKQIILSKKDNSFSYL